MGGGSGFIWEWLQGLNSGSGRETAQVHGRIDSERSHKHQDKRGLEARGWGWGWGALVQFIPRGGAHGLQAHSLTGDGVFTSADPNSVLSP